MSAVYRVVWLVALWVVLWRDLSLANVVSGLAVGVAVTVLFPPRGARGWSLRPLALARFGLYFLWKLVESNLVLAREIVTPTNSIRTGIVAVGLPDTPEFVVTLVANVVTLTPGTLSLEVRREPTTLYVHVLHLHDVEQARADVLHLRDLASAAFRGRDERSRLGAPR